MMRFWSLSGCYNKTRLFGIVGEDDVFCLWEGHDLLRARGGIVVGKILKPQDTHLLVCISSITPLLEYLKIFLLKCFQSILEEIVGVS